MVDYSKAVTWKDGERHHVGKVARGLFPVWFVVQSSKHEQVLIRHVHTGELEFVSEDVLRQYPSEEIPTP